MANESWVYQGRQAHGYFGSGTSPGSGSPGVPGVIPVGDDGMPGDPARQNKQFRDVCHMLGLNQDQRELLHREIHGENCTFRELLERAMEMFPR